MAKNRNESFRGQDGYTSFLWKIRSAILYWSAQKPFLSLAIIISSSLILLPLITATALMPIVMLLDFSNFLATKGPIYVVYTILFQGVILTILLIILFLAAFAIATSISVLHSYKIF